MRVFKATYKDRKGKARESSKWYVEFRDHLETVRRLPAFTDRKQSEAAGRNIEKLVACRVNRQAPDVELGRWLESLPSTLRDKLAKCGLLDAQTATSHKTIAQHLADFQAALEAKGGTSKHVGMVLQRVRGVFDGCGFKTWLDVRAAKVDRWLAEQRQPTKDSLGLSIQSSNHYLKACKQFGRWMIENGRASESPLAHLKALNVATDRRHDRRALSADESRRLLVAAQSGPERLGMAGAERALVYRLALETGLRANEIASLTRQSFRFGAKLATVVVEAGNSKHRERDELPLRPDTADLLKAHLATKLPKAKAFAMPRIDDVAGMMRADLEAARQAWLNEAGAGTPEREARERSDFLVYQDSEGLFADFHALRHTFVSALARANVPVKLAQTLARHKDPRLTLARYAHVDLSDQFDALEALPDLSATMAMEQRATGTDDATAADTGVLSDCLAVRGAVKSERPNDAQSPDVSGPDSVLAFCLALSSEKLAVNPTDGDAPATMPETQENPEKHGVFEGESELHPTGLEPVTFGSVDRLDDSTTSETTTTCDDAAERLGVLLGALGAEFDGLPAVVKAWRDLPDAIRRAILAMVDAAQK